MHTPTTTLAPNPEYMNAPYELSYWSKDGRFESLVAPVPLRFSADNAQAAQSALEKGDFVELKKLSIPTHTLEA